MKHITVFVGFVMLVLLTGARPVPADPCQLTGSGAKIREHPVQPVAPGGPITVRIIKTHPGYAAGSLDRSGEDADRDDVILDHRARRGLVWAVAGGGYYDARTYQQSSHHGRTGGGGHPRGEWRQSHGDALCGRLYPAVGRTGEAALAGPPSSAQVRIRAGACVTCAGRPSACSRSAVISGMRHSSAVQERRS
jgi:hypothetical protein